MVLFWILGAVFVVSSISLVGVVTLALSKKSLQRLLLLFVGFAAGGLVGGAFLHLLPEALEVTESSMAFFFALVGFCFFFFMERYFFWRHCHKGKCDIHAFTYLNLLGDGIHNFIDGLVIAASFLREIKLGIITTVAIIFHEIPQELGDFGILVYGGFSRKKALFSNFLCALTAIGGALGGYFLAEKFVDTLRFLIPFAAGGFIYIGSCDLIPELHRQKEGKRASLSFGMFVAGLILMYLMRLID